MQKRCHAGVVTKSVPLSAAQAVDLLAVTTGVAYELVGRLRGGETGAHEVLDPRGGRLVVKWDTGPSSEARRQAVDLSERLRVDGGWPIPRQRTVVVEDCLFVLQDFMPGAPVEILGHAVVERLLELHARRIDLARPSDPSGWPARLIETLIVGGEDYCRHDSLRRYDQRTAALLDRIEGFGRAVAPDDLVAADVMHWDLHPGNLLHEQGTLSAVVDTDFAQVGDGAFDLVTLALASLSLPCDRGVRSRLFGAAFDGLPDVRRRAYLGHLFIRFLDWPIRRGRDEEVEFWLGHAGTMLDL
jgi:hypothetical protein